MPDEQPCHHDEVSSSFQRQSHLTSRSNSPTVASASENMKQQFPGGGRRIHAFGERTEGQSCLSFSSFTMDSKCRIAMSAQPVEQIPDRRARHLTSRTPMPWPVRSGYLWRRKRGPRTGGVSQHRPRATQRAAGRWSGRSESDETRMYPTSIDGKPSAGGFRMPPQTVSVFRTGFSRSDREFEDDPDALSGNKCFPTRARPAVNLKPSSIAALPVLLQKVFPWRVRDLMDIAYRFEEARRICSVCQPLKV